VRRIRDHLGEPPPRQETVQQRRAALADLGTTLRRVPRGGIAADGYEARERLTVLREGFVVVTHSTPSGRTIVADVLGPGSVLLPTVALLHVRAGLARPDGRAVALHPVVVAVTSAVELRAAARVDSTLVATLAAEVEQALRQQERRAVDRVELDVVRRLAARIVELVDRWGVAGACEVTVHPDLTQEQWASWIGASREAVGLALRTLTLEGALHTARRRVTVTHLGRLRSVASGARPVTCADADPVRMVRHLGTA
jgi:CRP/FNR family transcriptional regulator, cyclic AMP receptor protein